MQRNVIIPIVGGVVAALVLVGAILLIGHRHKTADLSLVSPPPTESATPLPSATETPSPSPTATASPGASAGPSATPQATAKPTPTPHPVRAVSSVNCSAASDAKYCSNKDGMTRKDGKTAGPANKPPPSYSDAPTISMQSSGTTSKIHIVVTVENKTSKTFHFPQREIDLEMTKDGKHFASLATHGAGFDMAPGAKMTGTFDQNIADDGTYVWQAKVWYYAK